ncbi:MAG: hypothetical protein U0599_03950 [Vicinamibacteria bacterium]
MRDYLTKGRRSLPRGVKIRYEEWTDKDSNKRNTTRIRVQRAPARASSSSAGRGEGGSRSSGGSSSAPRKVAVEDDFQASDEDVPF